MRGFLSFFWGRKKDDLGVFLFLRKKKSKDALIMARGLKIKGVPREFAGLVGRKINSTPRSALSPKK